MNSWIAVELEGLSGCYGLGLERTSVSEAELERGDLKKVPRPPANLVDVPVWRYDPIQRIWSR